MKFAPKLFFTFVTFLVPVHVAECFITQFLDSVSGEIQGGNFSYFNLHHLGLVSLELISHSGDCDLYVSQFKTKPTFELGSYCSASSSCGLDEIIVPKSFKRPLAVGIYGHPSHEVSAYTLNIYQISETSDADNESDELYVATKYSDFKAYMEEKKIHKQSVFSYFYYLLSLIFSSFQNVFSYFYYLLSLIFSSFQNLYNFLHSMEENSQFHPFKFCLNFLVSLF